MLKGDLSNCSDCLKTTAILVMVVISCKCCNVAQCCHVMFCTQAAHCYIHIAALVAEYLKRRGV